MFSFFRRRSKKDRLWNQYKNLLKRAHQVSKSDRKKADLLQAEAEEIYQEIERLQGLRAV